MVEEYSDYGGNDDLQEVDYTVNKECLQSRTESAPFTEERLVQILEGVFSDEEQVDDNYDPIKTALERLTEVSSRHKFVVNVTEVRGTSREGLEISGRLGASWDAVKDGMYNHRVTKGGSEFLITVLWLIK
ncbi:HCL175Wp [Eremothecium sinecaudum]|uniref:Topoisomerase I damage affected protein 2 n=1 Tax=Eremothecium sinecaudum TaxID=45286 RepID=A0A0X8HQ89_9SACH|nr:HCL175Wp [Eremothecium sinecaudum]AMD19976.1 HCL175Wp [Eremothecium sinecaudum]